MKAFEFDVRHSNPNQSVTHISDPNPTQVSAETWGCRGDGHYGLITWLRNGPIQPYKLFFDRPPVQSAGSQCNTWDHWVRSQITRNPWLKARAELSVAELTARRDALQRNLDKCKDEGDACLKRYYPDIVATLNARQGRR
jgi:hypothetical protein